MQLRQRFSRMLAWERAVLVLSFWLAVILFLIALLWGNAVHLLRGTESVSFVDAGLWFIRMLMLGVMAGTGVNVLAFLVGLIGDVLRRARS